MAAKRKSLSLWIGIVVVLAVVGAGAYYLLSSPGVGIIELSAAARSEAAKEPFSYKHYAAVLGKYVDKDGMVNYKALHANPQVLDTFIATLGALDNKHYEKWSTSEKIAFWTNAYNALTLKAIIAHYPIKPPRLSFKSLKYPKNSIRQIPGVWTKLKFTVMGKDMTLNHIEHKILRPQFNEPRIHMALVCAAVSCPPLRGEPYTAEKLSAQLDDQAKRFLKTPSKFRIDRQKGTVHLSMIFTAKWFGGDFSKTYGTDKVFKGYSDSDRAVLNFVSKYLNEKDRAYLREGAYKIKHLKYSWTLNEKAKPTHTSPAGTSGKSP